MAKVVYAQSAKLLNVNSLTAGTLFFFDGRLYMKLDGEPPASNVLAFEDSRLTYFTGDALISVLPHGSEVKLMQT